MTRNIAVALLLTSCGGGDPVGAGSAVLDEGFCATLDELDLAGRTFEVIEAPSDLPHLQGATLRFDDAEAFLTYTVEGTAHDVVYSLDAQL